MSPVLVLGATGIVGRRVVAELTRLGVPVRAASRRGSSPFELGDPDTWPPVLDDVAAMFLMSPEGVPLHPGLVEAATAAGIERIVLLSDKGAEVMRVQRLLDAEQAVRASSAAWTVLRPDWFDQNFDESFFRPGILAGRVTVPIGEVRQGFVDAADIAAVAARCLVEDTHAGRTYELTGPEALSFADALATIGTAAGREIRFDGTEEVFADGQRRLGVPEDEVAVQLADFRALAARGDAEPSGHVEQVLGRPARSVAEFARTAAAAGAW